MPENVHSLDLKGIRAVCAARGLRVPEGSSRDEAISLLERHAGTSVDNEEGAPSAAALTSAAGAVAALAAEA